MLSMTSAKFAITLVATTALASAAFAGGGSTGNSPPATQATAANPNVGGDSGGSSRNFSTAVYSFAATPSMVASIASAPGATVVNGPNGQTISLPFTEGGVTYLLVVEPNSTVTVYRA